MIHEIMAKPVSNTSHDSEDVQAEMYFLSRDELFQTVKPYSMRYPPRGDFPQSNIKREKHSLEIRTMRNKESCLNFDDSGFGIMPLNSKMRYEDFGDPTLISSVYAKEIDQALRSRLKATHVYVINSVVRKRHPTFPVSTGENYEYNQPTAIAHIDFTLNEAETMIRNLYGARAEELLAQHWQVVNVWRPLRGPLRDWPLALCDARSVNFQRDTMPADIVFRDWATENLQVHYNPLQTWYYLPDQLPSEALIFKSADSRPDSNFACPHSGFFNPNVSETDPPRESIDCRAFVFYADLECMPAEVGPPHRAGK